MALDGSGHVHILGIGPRPSDPYSSAIVYSTDAGGPWGTSTVTTVRLVEFAGAPISLAITSDGRVHVLQTSEGPGGASLIDMVNVPGLVPLADVLQRWGAIATWVLVAVGVGLFAVWLATRMSRYQLFRSERRTRAEAKFQELKAVRRGPP